MRPIDADALREEWLWNGANEQVYDTNDFLNSLDAAPTLDVEPARHGRWIEKPFLLGTTNECSLCHSFYGMPHEKFNYCPHCGAKMDEEKNGNVND